MDETILCPLLTLLTRREPSFLVKHRILSWSQRDVCTTVVVVVVVPVQFTALWPRGVAPLIPNVVYEPTAVLLLLLTFPSRSSLSMASILAREEFQSAESQHVDVRVQLADDNGGWEYVLLEKVGMPVTMEKLSALLFETKCNGFLPNLRNT